MYDECFFENDLLHVSYLVVFRQGRHFESRFLEVRTQGTTFQIYLFLLHFLFPLTTSTLSILWNRTSKVTGQTCESKGKREKSMEQATAMLVSCHLHESMQNKIHHAVFTEIQKYQDAFPFMTSSARVSSPPRVGLKIESNIVFPLCLSNIVPN